MYVFNARGRSALLDTCYFNYIHQRRPSKCGAVVLWNQKGHHYKDEDANYRALEETTSERKNVNKVLILVQDQHERTMGRYQTILSAGKHSHQRDHHTRTNYRPPYAILVRAETASNELVLGGSCMGAGRKVLNLVTPKKVVPSQQPMRFWLEKLMSF
jgi:hypothetical protein